MTEGNGAQFYRGVAAGEIAQRLKEHDTHLNKINGSMGDVAEKLGVLTLQMQRMEDAMTANEATVLKTASALKAAYDARRDQSTQRWSPLARIAATVGALAGAAGAGAGLWSTFHH